MEEWIKKSDAIKAVWGDDINPSEDGMVFEAQSHIDRDIRLIPSADRPTWIPCSERLPSKQGQYLVTTYACDDYYYVDVLSFHKGEFYSTDSEWGDMVDNDVTAWMPLPKPYGEREGE